MADDPENRGVERKYFGVTGPSVDDDFEPVLGKAYCHFVLTKSNVKPTYHLVFPAKLYKDLPSETAPAEIIYGGKTWETVLSVDEKKKKLDGKWKKFVEDNELQIGDALFWEVLESNKEKVKFKVQIIRGDFPSELEPKESGSSEDAPIIVT